MIDLSKARVFRPDLTSSLSPESPLPSPVPEEGPVSSLLLIVSIKPRPPWWKDRRLLRRAFYAFGIPIALGILSGYLATLYGDFLLGGH